MRKRGIHNFVSLADRTRCWIVYSWSCVESQKAAVDESCMYDRYLRHLPVNEVTRTEWLDAALMQIQRVFLSFSNQYYYCGTLLGSYALGSETAQPPSCTEVLVDVDILYICSRRITSILIRMSLKFNITTAQSVIRTRCLPTHEPVAPRTFASSECALSL